MTVAARIEGVIDGVLRGWAVDEARPGARLDLLVLADDTPIATIRADRMRGDLQRRGIGDGAHGFECALPVTLQDGASHHLALRLASAPEGPSIADALQDVARRTHMLQGKLERVAERRLVGWIWDRSQADLPVTVELLVAGELVATTMANRFRRDLLTAGIGTGSHGFIFPLDDLPPDTARGALATVRATAEHQHWVLGSLALPDLAPQPLREQAPPPAAARPGAQVAPAPAPRALPGQTAPAALAQAREAERKRDFAQAAAILDTALRKAPRDFDLLFLRARVAMALNDFATAGQLARAALVQRPQHARPTVILARIATTAGNHAEAVDLWGRIGPGEDSYRERLLKRGRSLLALGRAAEALGEFLAGVRLNPEDRDARLGAAEAAEATGAVRPALSHWRRLAAVAPQDRQAQERISDLARRLAPAAEALPSPLRDPWLRDWMGAVEGAADREWLQPCAGLTLRGIGGAVRFAAAAPSVRRPGEPPGYGIWLNAEGLGAELHFPLLPNARAALLAGLRMAIEVHPAQGMQGAAPLPLRISLVGPAERALHAASLGQRPRLFTFDLTLTAPEAEALESGQVALSLLLGAPGVVVVQPPRPIAVLQAPAMHPDTARAAEDAAGMAGLRQLGLLGERNAA